MKKKILEICLSPDLGGLELVMLKYFEDFSTKTDCKLVVSPGAKLDEHMKVQEKYLLKRNKYVPLIPAFKLAKIIDDNNIDFIHFHWTKDMAMVVLAKIISKNKPKIMQTRHMTMTRFKDDFYHKWLYKNIDILHAITYQVKEQIEKFIPDSVRPRVEKVFLGIEENNVDVDNVESLRKKYILNNSFVVGIVGRIEDAKGQYIVIEALKKLKNLDIHVLIVGHTMDSSYLLELNNKVKSLGLEKRVIFTGFTKDVDAHMKLCDVVVLATEKETFGLVVIEAMINKSCVIATDSGGPLEIIEDNVDGIFFNRTSDDLASKIEKLYKDKDLLKSISEAGYKKARKKFDRDTQSAKLYEIIEKS